MGLLNLLFEHPAAFLVVALPLLYSVILHELAHGWAALLMGDPTARRAGRLSLNPLKHLDPVGTLMLLFFGFGWARPVPVNPANFRGNRAAMVFVSSAGIAVNLLLAFLSFLLLEAPPAALGETTVMMVAVMARINLILAAFNLIPIPPLDGSKILMGFLPSRIGVPFSRLEPYGFFILIGLLYFGVLDPVIRAFHSALLWVIQTLLFR
jgi:Zn-dependent protease